VADGGCTRWRAENRLPAYNNGSRELTAATSISCDCSGGQYPCGFLASKRPPNRDVHVRVPAIGQEVSGAFYNSVGSTVGLCRARKTFARPCGSLSSLIGPGSL
jgi:hypothetical protein